MAQDSQRLAAEKSSDNSSYTRQEIFAQATLWPGTVRTVVNDVTRLRLSDKLGGKRVMLAGAGTSAYAAESIADAWPQASFMPTTDLLVDAKRLLAHVDVLVSLARSGDSPESVAVVEVARSLRPDLFQLAIVCNPNGALAQGCVDQVIQLDPRTDDHSLVMTASFSNLVLAGLTLAQPDEMLKNVDALSSRTLTLLPDLDRATSSAAHRVVNRMMVLSSSPLAGWRKEAALKTLEMTAGRFSVLSESYLGLRHGPMVFVAPETLVFCLLSNDPFRRAYELDLVGELREKKIGFLVGITDMEGADRLFDAVIPAIAPHMDDTLRTPFEIVAAQLLGYNTSLLAGLNPDNPSPDGIINRVVQGVKIHPLNTALSENAGPQA